MEQELFAGTETAREPVGDLDDYIFYGCERHESER